MEDREETRVADVVEQFEITAGEARTALWRLHQAGRIDRPKRGVYVISQ
jgi:predicted transcriptional regulator of viral defense system